MKLTMLIFFYCFVNINIQSVEPVEKSAKSILDIYSDKISIKKNKNGLRFSYCPDNTCDLLDIGTNDEQIVWEVGIVFLYYKSTYVYLRDFKKMKEPIEVIKKIVEKHKLVCKRESKYNDCVFSKLSTKYEIKQHFARYDEGKLIVE